MDFSTVVTTINRLLAEKQPTEFNSSWVRKHSPSCYRFIQKHIRREYGGIDWDSLTHELDRKFQRLWNPGKLKSRALFYEDRREVETILNKHHEKMYVFISPSNANDRCIADSIGISFVRLAQNGNLLAQKHFCDLVRFTVETWIERHETIARWSGHEQEIREQIEGCIRRYRYTGSFLTYLFRTLEYAGRGIAPSFSYPLDYDREARPDRCRFPQNRAKSAFGFNVLADVRRVPATFF